jgi:hypothetical protein
MSNNFQEEVLIRFKADAKEALATYDKIKAKTQSLSKITSKNIKEMDVAFNNVVTTTKKLDSVIAKSKPRFAGWALSIMFAGMAIQRAFSSISKFGIKSFNDVAHSQEGVVTASDKLDGSMKYLGFTIGAALQPVIEWLVPIVEWIAEWVDENEGLAAGIVILGTTIGTVFAVGGAAVLALNGFLELGDKLRAIDWEQIGSNITKGIGIISIGYAFKEAAEAYAAFKDGKLGTALTEAISAGLFGFGGMRVLKGQKGGGALIAIGVAFELVKMGVFFDVFAKLMSAVMANAQSAFEFIANAFQVIVMNKIADRLDKMASWLAGIAPGLSIALKAAAGGIREQAKDKELNFVEIWKSNYEDNLATMQPIAKAMDEKISQFLNYLDNPTPKQVAVQTPNVKELRIYVDDKEIQMDTAGQFLRYARSNGGMIEVRGN